MVYDVAKEAFVHLSQTWYLVPSTYYCAAFLATSGALAAAAGIGGGGIIVAVLMFCGDMAPHDAVPMSKAVVFAGTVVSSGMNMRKRAPDGSPLIDYDIVASVVPLALAGTLCGVWLNSRVSPEVIVFMLIGTFLAMIASTTQKLTEQLLEESTWTVETSASAGDSAAAAGVTAQLSHEDAAARHARREKERESRLKQERRNMTLVWTLAALLASVILGGVLHKHMLDCHLAIAAGTNLTCESALLNLLFGTPHDFLGGLHGMGIAAFPLVAAGICCLLCFLILWLGFSAKHSQQLSIESLRYSCMAFVTGVLAGLVGIGGGLIFSPFMVWSGVNPHIAVATSTFCVIFTSTSTTLQYALMGRIFFPLAVVYGLCNQFSSYFGTVFIHRVQDRYPMHKSYPTAIVLAAVVVSAVLTLLKLHAMAVEHLNQSSLQQTSSS